ncbi:MAG: hypothetical protein K8T26_16770 [Lentisphaerae bacterium]|nr:hypothetical protein [Lentisphaerota bacterium]
MVAIRNMNDGTRAAPYLRTDFNLGGLTDLPGWSAGPRGDARAVLSAIKAAGYRGTQGGDPALSRELGLGCTSGGRVNKPGEIAGLAAAWKRAGYEAATLHVGWGHESDAEVDRLVHEIIRASAQEDLPLYIETHRATITQDTWRTVRLVERIPEVRFNADFSHWYSGLEMPYGNWEEKLAFLQPVFERVRFMHARCGNSSHIQVALDHPSMEKALGHFREMWTRSMAGFIKTAGPGDFLSFNPELLAPAINYAQTFRQSDGTYREASDRWLDALALTRLAEACFQEGQRRQA